jgi:hypothetical protein
MTIHARKAGRLIALALLVASAPSLQARSLWKTLFGAAAAVASWCTGQSAAAMPLDPPVPGPVQSGIVPSAPGNRTGDYPWVWLDDHLGLADGPVSTDGRPYPWQRLRKAPDSYFYTHLPACIGPEKMPSLHAALDEALEHYPASKCPGPLREHLPHERAEPGPSETNGDLVESLDHYDACRHYKLATAARMETLDMEVACALRAVRELPRKDRGLQLMERLEDAARLHDDLVAEMQRCKRMAYALDQAIHDNRHRPAATRAARADRDTPPLEERLALAGWLHAEMEAASKRFHRKVLPALLALMPAGEQRHHKRHDYCRRLQDEHFDTGKRFKFSDNRGRGQWQMDPLMQR